MEYIRQIADLCVTKSMTCLYVHGPLTASVFKPYFDEFAILMRAAGLKVALPPICMPWQDTGDAEDHVVPTKKSDYSQQYFNALKPLL
jgi:hypothetical protein